MIRSNPSASSRAAAAPLVAIFSFSSAVTVSKRVRMSDAGQKDENQRGSKSLTEARRLP